MEDYVSSLEMDQYHHYPSLPLLTDLTPQQYLNPFVHLVSDHDLESTSPIPLDEV
jgi:hypothetical protein